MWALSRTAAPAEEPITAEQCKLDSKIDGTEFDSVLPAHIQAAREECENVANQKLITQTWRAARSSWPRSDDVISLSPVQSATVSFWNGTTWETLATEQWALLPYAGGQVLIHADGIEWPNLADLAGHRVRVDVVCGYGNAAAVPAALKMWMRQRVASMLESPSGMTDNRKRTKGHFVDGLADAHRVWAI
jgi:uncharacterized phiE125 gp8 family phage protein